MIVLTYGHQVVPQFQSEDAFGKFSEAIAKVIEAQPDIATVDIVAMYSSLMMFALQVHREQLNYVDVVLAGCATALSSRGIVSEPKVRLTCWRCSVFVRFSLRCRPNVFPRRFRRRSSWLAC